MSALIARRPPAAPKNYKVWGKIAGHSFEKDRFKSINSQVRFIPEKIEVEVKDVRDVTENIDD